jgi:hypothetical protein
MSELQPLSQYVDRLSAERESPQAELDSIVYPVLTLPREITSEIFHWCLPSSPHFIQPDPADVPLTLLAICRQWRNVALTIPQLWSSVKFRLSIDSSSLAVKIFAYFWRGSFLGRPRILFAYYWMTGTRTLPLPFTTQSSNMRTIFSVSS